MSAERNDGSLGSHPLSALQEIDRICDAFDSAWSAGKRPSLGEYLGQCSSTHREKCFCGLLEIDLEYCRRAGESPTPADYTGRFPDFEELIEQVFADASLVCTSDHDHVASNWSGEAVGQILGRYKLLKLLGEGGFGVVYLAEQEKPVRRRVALKIIKLGMDTKQVIARFEAERQALALMEHPNIAKVLDAGATSTGRPFFVMELVQGVPITTYCDEHSVSLDERLRLFIRVCDAVQHAHQKGIIHRDLKPGNVLVKQVSERPIPKVIDFGIAKAIDQRLAEQTVSTQLGQFIGTPAYMSPEQAGVQALGIDTRSDIYSLGILLYELLTGRTPFNLNGKPGELLSLDEIKRIIREEEPSKPSTKLSTIGTAITTVASRRGMEPARLTGVLRGDLDWIVMKTLEKDRTRRYETANALADDIQRFLTHEVVQARPPSRWYRFAKYVRRNRGLVISSGIVLALLLLAIGGTSAGLFEARHERAAALRMAERNKRTVQAFVKAFESANPQREGNTSDITARQVLEHALATIGDDASLKQDPLTKAALVEAIGSSLFGIGAFELALSAFETAFELKTAEFGPAHLETLGSATQLCQALVKLGESDRALELLERTVPLLRQDAGDAHPVTLDALIGLASAKKEAGDYAGAIQLYEEVLDTAQNVSPEGDKTQQLISGLSDCYREAGQVTDAIPLMERSLAQLKSKYGADHSLTNTAQMALGNLYYAASRYQEALPLYEHGVAYTKNKLGPQHPDSLKAINNLAMLYLQLNRTAEALPLFEETLDLHDEIFGPQHPKTLLMRNNLARCYLDVGRVEDAVAVFEQLLPLTKETLGPTHPQTIAAMNNLAFIYSRMKRFSDAVPLFEESRDVLIKQVGDKHPYTLISTTNLAVGYQVIGRVEEAYQLYEQALRGWRETLGTTHGEALKTYGLFVFALLENKEFERAEEAVHDWLENLQSVEQPKQLAEAQLALAESQFEQGRLTDAMGHLEAVKTDDLGDIANWRLQNLRGAILSKQEQWDDAEHLLISSARSLEEQLTEVEKLWIVVRAMERVVAHYQACNEAEETSAWNDRLARFAAHVDSFRSIHPTARETIESSP